VVALSLLSLSKKSGTSTCDAYNEQHLDDRPIAGGNCGMTYTPTQILTFEEFLNQYRDDPRYELADGELIDMDPTGPHEAVGGKLTIQIGMAFSAKRNCGAPAAAKLPWFIPRTCLIRPFAEVPTARRPDIVVLDETLIDAEPLWQQEPVITLGKPIKLVVEVVSSNWETDYARKVEEYALLGIPEYWIADYRGLGGVAFIGKPKQPTLTVCTLQGEDYEQQQYRLGQPIRSNLQLRLDDILPR
jgi:Uma2 family endonuclease